MPDSNLPRSNRQTHSHNQDTARRVTPATQTQPTLAARDALKENSGANGKKVRKRAKTAVVMADAETRLEHAKSLQHQGELFRSVEDGEASSAWSSAVLSLPPEQSKFALNASQDTLPHNVNLGTSLLHASCVVRDRHSSMS